jgi:hypothetical protein
MHTQIIPIYPKASLCVIYAAFSYILSFAGSVPTDGDIGSISPTAVWVVCAISAAADGSVDRISSISVRAVPIHILAIASVPICRSIVTIANESSLAASLCASPTYVLGVSGVCVITTVYTISAKKQIFVCTKI